jgi:hypothetical protein
VSETADRAIDDLYAGDLDDFVARRDQLAKELRTAGDRDAATMIKQLRKPSRAAWAVNQAVRRDPARFDAVLEAGAALRDAQQRALREGAGTGLHDAVRARQRAVSDLAGVGVAALGATGASARDAIEQTLQAASIDADAADAVREARLVQELEPPDIFATLEPGPARPARAKAPAPAPVRPRREAPVEPKPPTAARRKALDKADAAEADATAARREADAAQREAENAKARADELTEAAREAASAADEARAAARDAATGARDARKAAERAEQTARRARTAATD